MAPRVVAYVLHDRGRLRVGEVFARTNPLPIV